MKVLLKRDHYSVKDGKTVELEKGEHDLDQKQAEVLVKRGVANALESESKEPSAADIVKLIKAAESLEQIEVYAEDERKTVKEAFEAKLAELSENSE